MNKRPVLIDTDPGTDDAIAIIMCLLSKKLDVKAITTIGGNVPIELTSQNAKNIIAFCHKSISVSIGASRPLYAKPIYSPHIHGFTGMGNLVLETDRSDFDSLDAVDRIYQEAIHGKGQLEILTLGALTNIAGAILKYPDLASFVKSMVIMGGSFGTGNRTPTSEFNIFADPEAARIVFHSKIPITMVGLNVTHETIVTKEENQVLHQINHKIARGVAQLIDFTQVIESKYNNKGAIMHDPLAAAVLIEDSVVTTKACYVDVELTGELTRGMTVVDLYNRNKKPANIKVAMKADNPAFVRLLQRLMTELIEV